LSASEANILQHVAFETVQQLQKAGGYLGLERPPFPQPPTLPEGGILEAARLVGTWRGPLHFFRQPGSMQLRLEQHDNKWQGEWSVSIDDGKVRASAPVTSFRVDKQQVIFRVRNRHGVSEWYRGVLTDDNTLHGIAHTGTPSDLPYMVGSWTLTRQP
jgi:hypothetical protein